MLATRLIRLVQSHADELVNAAVADLRTNPRTRTFNRVPESELRHRLRDLYSHLGDWVGERTESRVEAYYTEVGRRRFHDGVPLAELVFAIMLSKDHLRHYIRLHGLVESVVELYAEEQLYQMTWSFFDRAIYFGVKGYEEERLHVADMAAARPHAEPTPR
jgi:hypothetical protein